MALDYLLVSFQFGYRSGATFQEERMAGTVEENARILLKALYEASQKSKQPLSVTGGQLQELTDLDPNQINDAVEILHDRGQVEWVQHLGTAPFSFGKIDITPRGKVECESASEHNNTTHAAPPAGRIFITWSGETKPVAEALHRWLPSVSNAWQPWLSDRDIQAGKKWQEELRDALKEACCAVQCLSPEAASSPWVIFEAGAVGHSRPIIPYLLHMSAKDLPSPLAIYQAVEGFDADGTSPGRDGMIRLAEGITAATGVPVTDYSRLDWEPVKRALEEFHKTRVRRLLGSLESNRRVQPALLTLLQMISDTPGHSPETLTDQQVIRDVFVKRHVASNAIFFLQRVGLLQVEGFDNWRRGRVVITADGRRVLAALEERG